jgi:hypothetical protein
MIDDRDNFTRRWCAAVADLQQARTAVAITLRNARQALYAFDDLVHESARRADDLLAGFDPYDVDPSDLDALDTLLIAAQRVDLRKPTP